MLISLKQFINNNSKECCGIEREGIKSFLELAFPRSPENEKYQYKESCPFKKVLTCAASNSQDIL